MKDQYEHLLHEDELAKWRREGEQYAQAKPDEDRVQRFAKDMSDQRLALRSELSEMRAELQRVCSEHDADRDSILELTKTVGKVLDDLPNWMEAVARKSQNELRGLIAERSGETVAQLRALDARVAKAEDGLTQAVARAPEDVPALIESVVQRTCVEVRTLASDRLNELEAQIRVLADAKVKASEPFKFAGEKADDDSLVLPNPLRRREIN